MNLVQNNNIFMLHARLCTVLVISDSTRTYLCCKMSFFKKSAAEDKKATKAYLVIKTTLSKEAMKISRYTSTNTRYTILTVA